MGIEKKGGEVSKSVAPQLKTPVGWVHSKSAVTGSAHSETVQF